MKIDFSAQIKFGSGFDETAIRSVYGKFIPANKDILPADSFEKNTDTLDLALEKLSELNFSKDDIKKIQRYGARPIFKSGREALDFARTNKIPIVFGEVEQPDIHAQWVNDRHVIVINSKYKDNKEPAIVYAISAAIMHELAHAKDGDGISSIQEEIDCLAMNALAFNEYKKKNPQLFKDINLPIIKDGVELYANLFMGNNPKALEERVKSKYGNLPVGSPNHEPKKFAMKIAEFA